MLAHYTTHPAACFHAPRRRAAARPRSARASASSPGEQAPPRRAHLRATGSSSHTLRSHGALRCASVCLRGAESLHLLAAPRLPQFFASQEGHTCCLALNEWRWERLGAGQYRCYAARTTFLAYEVEPALDLVVEVSEDNSSCVVRLLGAALGGSAAVQQQSQRFAASATHTITWEGTTLRSAVEMQVELELFAGPFKRLPRAAVERPGAALLSRMLRKSLDPFLARLEVDYLAWEAQNPQLD